MTKDCFLRVALPTPLTRLFDYLPPQDIDYTSFVVGSRVKVPFQRRELVGILIEVTNTSLIQQSKLKRAVEVLDKESVYANDIYKLCQWASDYYHYSLGEVLASALPTYLRKGKKIPTLVNETKNYAEISSPYILNQEQQDAVKQIMAANNEFKIFMLDGVTGSGKTEVYLQAIAAILKAGQQVLVLVPEISLTPQTIDRFKKRFNEPIVALHSSLTEKQRFIAWCEVKSGKARIVIGTRSAIFTPFENLGMIIVDEEHDLSFKQQDRFRYHARDMAVMRGSILKIPVVLGSATPSLESLLNVQRQRYQPILLRERAGNAQLPIYELVDIKKSKLEDGLSETLIERMAEHLSNNNQVMLFLNRRGYAPVLYCTDCAWIADCKRCDARMVYHRINSRLHCHHCDTRMPVPRNCPNCKSNRLEALGLGTQRLEQRLISLFPNVPIIRVDRDSTKKKGAMHELLNQIHQQNSSILLGTQMLAKGHHFPQVTLVGIVDADTGLFSADFRASEQMGQLLLQVAGRAGREEKAGTVLIQTRHPEHPLLKLLLEQGYDDYSKALLSEREKASLPPYTYFAVIKAESYHEKSANDFLINIKNNSEQLCENIVVLGPVSALMAKRKGMYCKHLIFKSKRRNQLQEFLKQVEVQIEKIPTQQNIKWVLDVDPMEV